MTPLPVWLAIVLIPHPAGISREGWDYLGLFAGVIVALVLEPLPPAAVGLLGVPAADRARFDPWVATLVGFQDEGFALTRVIGTNVKDDDLSTVFSTTLAGLLGLFVTSPASSTRSGRS